MSSKFHLIFFSLILILVSSENLNIGLKFSNYHSKIDASIDRAIDRFETEQQEKMKAGFTSDARRSYKKTKYSLAMEARNEIFRNALMDMQKQFPSVEEKELAKEVLTKIPSHFDAFGAKRDTTTGKIKIQRELNEACHGFPLHLPGHVEPCRDKVKIECNNNDEKIRRINGECNNLDNKRWGAQVLPLARLLPRQHEKFQIPLHDVEQNTGTSGTGKRRKRQSNGDELIGLWKATVSGTNISCVPKASSSNAYRCKYGSNKATVTWSGANFVWNYGSVTGTISSDVLTWSSGGIWERQDQNGWVTTNTGEYKVYNVNYNGICSKSTGCTWDQSKQVCEQEGGYLVKIASASENQNIVDFMTEKGVHYHIGLNDKATEGEYRWASDNTLMSYTNWYQGFWTEPTVNWGGDEDCAFMYNSNWNTNGKWADVLCSSRKVRRRKLVPFCERDPAPACPTDCDPSECQTTTISLPNARFASATLHSDFDKTEPNVTNLLMQFAQFVDHDISLSPEASTSDCCKNPYQEECMAIMIPENDVYFRQLNNQTCMQFTRSVPYCPENIDSCTKRENMNIISGILDTSNVYGSDERTATCLRNFTDGKLTTDADGLLPVAGANLGGFGTNAGDSRAPEMPALSTMHALWMREHNRICDLLKTKIGNPSIATDEYLYQNAKRILNAEFQNVVYGEQIPIVEGPDAIQKHNLELSADGTTYNPNINPSILAEFSTASNRYGHSLVQGVVDVHNTDLTFSHTYQLADNLLNPAEYQGAGYHKMIAGLIQQPSQQFDRFMTEDLTRHMFRGIFTPPGSDYGLDLASLNIQRGRDHGLPSYYELYNVIGDQSDPHRDMSCWARRPQSFSAANWDLLKKVYRHPRDIELFSGGLLDERPNGITANPILGAMFSEINSIQFSRLKDGDRFFFTHNNGAAGFTKIAREAIMKRKMSDIICDNSDVQKVQRNAFLPENSSDNPFVTCGSHTPLDIDDINLIAV